MLHSRLMQLSLADFKFCLFFSVLHLLRMLDLGGFHISDYNVATSQQPPFLVCISTCQSHQGGSWPFVYVEEPSDMVPGFCVSWSQRH